MYLSLNMAGDSYWNDFPIIFIPPLLPGEVLWIFHEYSPNGYFMKSSYLSHLLFLHWKVNYTLCLASIILFMPNYVIMHYYYLIDCFFPLGNCSLHKLNTVSDMLRAMLKFVGQYSIKFVLSGMNGKLGSNYLVKCRRFYSFESWSLFTTFKYYSVP